MVGGAGNAPVVTSDVCFATPDLQAGSRNTSRLNLRFTIYDLRFAIDESTHWGGLHYLLIGAEIGSGGGNHTHLKEFMRLLSVL